MTEEIIDQVLDYINLEITRERELDLDIFNNRKMAS
jgi:hypothetical protein